MSAARKLNLISIEDYLSGELISPIKHEYLGGAVYAMAEARISHNLAATNALTAVGARLRGKRCRPYNSGMKIRVRLPAQIRFYYPEFSVVCKSNPQSDSYQDEPVVIAEVLSKRTRRIDEGEKKDAYLTIPSLCVYLLIEQEIAVVVAYRRTIHGFVRQEYVGLDGVVPLPEIDAELPLAEIYEGVEFIPEADVNEP
jgi:Uma2 family endonuclease